MGAPFNSVSEAQDRANELEEYGQKLEGQIANLQEEMASVNDIRTGTLRWIASKQAASPNDGSRPITVDDIRHCRTQRAVLREWALRNGGHARITDVAELIMETNLPNGEKDSVRASLTNYAKDSDLWQYGSPRRVRPAGGYPVRRSRQCRARLRERTGFRPGTRGRGILFAGDPRWLACAVHGIWRGRKAMRLMDISWLL